MIEVTEKETMDKALEKFTCKFYSYVGMRVYKPTEQSIPIRYLSFLEKNKEDGTPFSREQYKDAHDNILEYLCELGCSVKATNPANIALPPNNILHVYLN